MKCKKQGRGLKDFIKKHKGKLAAATAVLGTIAAAGLASKMGNKKNKKLKLDASHPELGRFFENLNVSEPQHLGLIDPSLASYNPFLIDPHFAPYSQMGREEEKSGDGKPEIKEMVKYGKGFKEWIKKNKKALGITAGALTGILGTLAAVALTSGQQPVKGKIRQLQEGERPSSEVIREAIRSAPAAIQRPMYQPPVIEEEAKRPYHEPAIVSAPKPRSTKLKRLINPLLPVGFKRNPLQGVQGSESFKNIYSPIGRGSCGCGKNCYQIMESLGGYQAANYLVKHPKIGAGLIDGLIHKGVTKGFNFVGNVGLNLLIETIVKIIGEPFRKDVNSLVKKYGWKSLALIKKYAHKGINYVKQKVDEKFGGNLCPQCNDFLDNEFRCGNVDNLEKMGEGWKEDLANGLMWFSKSVIAPAIKIVPGSLGEALAYPSENIDKFVSLGSDHTYKNPFEDDQQEQPSFQGARSKPPKKGNGYVKPRPEYKSDTFEILASLIPSKLIGTMLGETMPKIEGNFSILPQRFQGRGKNKKNKLIEIGKKINKIVEYLPMDLLETLFWEIVKGPPSISVLPRRWKHDQDEISIWGNGRSGGTKMLPNPFYTDEEKEMMILPYPDEPEPDMRIQPYPFPYPDTEGEDYTKPYFKNGMGKYNYSNLQDPNFNTNKLIKGVSNNQDYKEYESGMKNKAQGVIIRGGKKNQTKKSILKKLRFEN